MAGSMPEHSAVRREYRVSVLQEAGAVVASVRFTDSKCPLQNTDCMKKGWWISGEVGRFYARDPHRRGWQKRIQQAIDAAHAYGQASIAKDLATEQALKDQEVNLELLATRMPNTQLV